MSRMGTTMEAPQVCNSEEVVDKTTKQSKQSTSLLAVMFFGSLGMLLFGYDTGVVSSAMVMVREDIDLDDDQAEQVVSMTLLLAAISTVVGVPLNSQFGRKPVVLAAALLYAAGSVIIAASGNFEMLVLGRALLGVAIGFASGTVPMYSAEMAPPSMRGVMVALNDMNIVVGQLLASGLNIYFADKEGGWRFSMGLAAAPAIVLFVGFFFLPESPRWLVMAGMHKRAECVLAVMHDGEEAQARLQDIVDAIEHEKEKAGDLHSENMFVRGVRKLTAVWARKEVRRAAILGIGLMAMNQLSGINTVMYYSTTILMKAGFTKDDAILLAAICCAAQLCGVVISVMSMDRVGRRVTGLRSTAGVVLTLLLLAISFTQSGKLWNGLKVAGLMLYLVSFGMGLSAVPWVANAEIYPLGLRSVAVGQSTVANWLFNFLVGRYFLSYANLVGTGAAFATFAVVSIVGGIWLYAMLPETMGLPLESIERLFEDPYPKSCCKGDPSSQVKAASIDDIGLDAEAGH